MKISAAGVPMTFRGWAWSKILDAMVGISSVAQGDILYRNATEWVRLAAGTLGQLLKTNGAGANPAWASIAAIVNSSYVITASSDQSKTADTTLGDDNALQCTLEANSKYRIHIDAFWDTNATADLKVSFAFTGTVTQAKWKLLNANVDTATLNTPATSSDLAHAYFATSTLTTVRTFNQTSSQTAQTWITLTIQTGASGGTLKLQWAQNVASGTTTRRKNSSMMVTQCS